MNMQLLYACVTFSIPLPLFSTAFPFTHMSKATFHFDLVLT